MGLFGSAEVFGPERLPATPWIDRSYFVTPRGPASQVVIVPTAPFPQPPERAGLLPWTDRSGITVPVGPQSQVGPFALGWMPVLPERSRPLHVERGGVAEARGPAAQVVIVPGAPLPPVQLERFPYPSWTDRTAAVTPQGPSSQLVIVPSLPPLPAVPERFPPAAFQDRSTFILAPVQPVAVTPLSWKAAGLLERYPLTPWTDRSGFSGPALLIAGQAAPLMAWDVETPERRLITPWTDRGGIAFPTGPAAQIVIVPRAPVVEIGPERLLLAPWSDRSSIVLPLGAFAVVVPTCPIPPAVPERRLLPWNPERGAASTPVGPTSQVVVVPPAPVVQFAPERLVIAPWLDRGHVILPLGAFAVVLPVNPIPATTPERRLLPWGPERSASATPLGPLSQVVIVPRVQPSVIGPERQRPQLADRGLSVLAPFVQVTLVPPMSWGPTFPDRLPIAILFDRTQSVTPLGIVLAPLIEIDPHTLPVVVFGSASAVFKTSGPKVVFGSKTSTIKRR